MTEKHTIPQQNKANKRPESTLHLNEINSSFSRTRNVHCIFLLFTSNFTYIFSVNVHVIFIKNNNKNTMKSKQ